MGAPGQTHGYPGMKRTVSATLLPCQCLQPMKSWLETALVCVAMAQAAGGETEPSKALSPLHFHTLLFNKTVRCCVWACSPILGLPVALIVYSFAGEKQMPTLRIAKVLEIWEHGLF